MADLSTEEAVCSCGVVGCRELGWPHEWDPIALGDDCVLVHPPSHTVNGRAVWPEQMRHKVTEPYFRTGSGYACAFCAEHGPLPPELRPKEAVRV